MLGADDLRELAASIRRHGQTAPCSMDPPGGSALDGRSRVAACALAGVEPRWEVYDGDPVAFVVEANAEDRNLSTGQRAMAVAIGLVEAGLRSNGRFRRGSVPEHPPELTRASWRDKVALAGFVLDHAPELGDRVLAGELGLDTAHKLAGKQRNHPHNGG
jgi:hypothetical protein